MHKIKQRIQWLDFAKGLLIFFVVLVHFLGYINFKPFRLLMYFIFIFIMPCFFAISGYLYNPVINLKGYIQLLYKKISSFVIPYVFFSLIYICSELIKKNNISLNYIKLFINNLYRLYLNPIGYLWFLYSLFFIFIIVGIVDLFKIRLYIKVSISFIVLVISSYLPWQESQRDNVNPLAGIGEYLFCFYIGYLLKKYKIYVKIYFNNKLILTISMILWIVLVVIQMFTTNLRFNSDMINYHNIIIKLLSIPICLITFSYLPHNKLFKYFDKYGKYTLAIYLVHFPILLLLSKIISKILINDPIISCLIYLICGWYISIFICYLSSKIKILNFIFYPRKYINNIIKRTKWGRQLLKVLMNN